MLPGRLGLDGNEAGAGYPVSPSGENRTRELVGTKPRREVGHLALSTECLPSASRIGPRKHHHLAIFLARSVTLQGPGLVLRTPEDGRAAYTAVNWLARPGA